MGIAESDESSEIPVTVVIGNNTFIHDMTYNHVLGIVVFYQYTNVNSPLSVFGYDIPIYVGYKYGLENLKRNMNNKYSVDVISDTYFFNNKEFFRGLLTAAQWLNVDPHKYINNLIELQYNPVILEGLPNIDLNYIPKQEPISPTIIHLIYY